MRILILSFFNDDGRYDLRTKKTPLLDRDLFFGNPEITGGQLSPDGKWISFMKAHKGIMNVWVKKFDEAFDKAKPLTDSQRPSMVISGQMTASIFFMLKIKTVMKTSTFCRRSYGFRQCWKQVFPESRNLTPLKEVTAQIYDVSRLNPDIMMIGLNDRDKAWHDLYQLKNFNRRTHSYVSEQ
ncbi:MAG: hypothetical protein IPG79_16510 [Saprospiraceae bacterium]|nr:hypothetical protein [Saprospiraceae bacterium]